ncbi:hypothetical protein WR25_20281 [Diploscapter pachys]|uniref:Signal recognition particle 9 kDa protein n=1 Tax=Diploscapter pachys TaxID=2018661 RepID=A0A2A2LPE7_9BILA|nr:hypothetical protein WR25_20281 [Diploscapter pachys]
MVYITNWDEFVKRVEELQKQSPDKCRLVTKYSYRDKKLVIKYTDDVVCLQYATDQQQDVKKLEKLTGTLMRATLSQE